MRTTCWIVFVLGMLLLVRPGRQLDACCPAPPRNEPVVNADQTVLMIWDSQKKTQHFIRQASFKSAARDFGFLVPTPTEPELAEHDQAVFTRLAKLTEPELIRRPRPAPNVGCGCSSTAVFSTAGSVNVLQEKLVAGYKAVVLEASDATALTNWLKDNGFADSAEVRAWAEPYIQGKWKFTALRLAKPDEAAESPSLNAGALRITFKTDRPLFPYREPKSDEAAASLKADSRMLRIYFVADARMLGKFPDGTPWDAKAAWSNRLSPDDRLALLQSLRLPDSTGPAVWHLTEFEHRWPYANAIGDVYFEKDPDQSPVKRPPWIEYTRQQNGADLVGWGLLAIALIPCLARRLAPGR